MSRLKAHVVAWASKRAPVWVPMATLLAVMGWIAMALAAEKTVIVLGTATPGGGFPVYGEAVASAINAADLTIDVQPRNTKGSTQNVPLLEAGQLDIALVQGEVAYEALNGIGRPAADLRILSAMYATPGMFVVRADSPARSIADLKGQRVAFGARGSGLVILAKYVLDGLGLDRDRDFDAVFLDAAGDGPAMVIGGKVAALWGGGLGWPGFVAVADGPVGARFIVPDAAGLAAIQAKHTFLKRMSVPAGTYPGQTAAIPSVGSWSYICVRPSLEESVVYRLAKALHGAEGDLARRLPQARETTAANTLASVPNVQLLHAGVVRYFKDAGLFR
jgi:uncharacterized protein